MMSCVTFLSDLARLSLVRSCGMICLAAIADSLKLMLLTRNTKLVMKDS